MFKRIRQWLSGGSATQEPVAATPSPLPTTAAQSAALRDQGNRNLDQGRLTEAEICYRRALALDPQEPANRINLGFVLTELGQFPEARDYLMQAIAQDDTNSDSHYLLGTVCEKLGDLAQAGQHYRAALAIQPVFDVCQRDLVRVLFHQGKVDEAQTTLTQAMAMHPHLADLHGYQGHLAMARNAPAQAVSDYQRAIELSPGEADLRVALGEALTQLNRLTLAAESFEAARVLAPGHVGALKGLADVQQKLGRAQAAVELYQQGLTQAPDHPGLLANMGLALCELGQLEAARAACERATNLAPGLLAARLNLGIAHTQLGNLSDALICLQQAIALEPACAAAHANLGAVLQKQGHLKQAISCYRQAITLDANYLEAHSNLLFATSFSQDITGADFLQEARAFGARASEMADGGLAPIPLAMSGSQGLRVGLVSGDLHEHPVGFFLENVLRHLDVGRIELYAYDTRGRDDRLTQRIRPFFKQWRILAGLHDADAAALIRQDGIDILMDLAGHTAHNRLPLFAWRPAPVTVSWLGWFASTGLQQIDYFLADPVSVPAEHHPHFSEKVWYLPQTRFCFTPPAETHLEVSRLPALETGYPTFGCFQQIGKINDRVLEAWSQIAHALPQARFHVQNQCLNTPTGREDFCNRLRLTNLEPERFSLYGTCSREDYLKAYQTVDIALDTFPYNGATTTCEGLWMGVPTVTLAGDRLVARQGASLMACAGLADWVADSEAAYAALAIQKASAPAALNQLRMNLRAAVLASPVFDAPQFAEQLLQALEGMKAGRAQPGITA